VDLRREILVGICAAAASTIVGAAFFLRGRRAPATGPEEEDMFAALCITAPRPAIVPDGAKAQHVFRLAVPALTPAAAAIDENQTPPLRVGKNRVIEIQISATRKGALAVHGLTGLARVDPGTLATLRFRSIYTGRFPVHFHGVDGSHFEIAVLEIRD
jgi:hypothetical protein